MRKWSALGSCHRPLLVSLPNLTFNDGLQDPPKVHSVLTSLQSRLQRPATEPGRARTRRGMSGLSGGGWAPGCMAGARPGRGPPSLTLPLWRGSEASPVSSSAGVPKAFLSRAEWDLPRAGLWLDREVWPGQGGQEGRRLCSGSLWLSQEDGPGAPRGHRVLQEAHLPFSCCPVWRGPFLLSH